MIDRKGQSAGGNQKSRTGKILIATLREELLRRESGSLLGAEGDLLSEFGVSRSSLRQAARVLEQEQLLEVRRGIRGGYYVRRPDVSVVAQVAANYLWLRGARWSDLLNASRAVTAEICRLAATNPDPAKRERLARAVERMRNYDGSAPREFVRMDVGFQAAFTALADNAFLEVYQGISWGFGVNQRQISVWRSAGRIEQWRKQRVEMGEAILRGEAEVAVAFANRSSALIGQWIAEESENAELDVRGSP